MGPSVDWQVLADQLIGNVSNPDGVLRMGTMGVAVTSRRVGHCESCDLLRGAQGPRWCATRGRMSPLPSRRPWMP